MRIERAWRNGEIALPGGNGQGRVTEDRSAALPGSWRGDSVSFSPEALAALQNKRENFSESSDVSESERQPGAGGEFKAYMAKKRSRAQGVENLEELIERLKEKAAEISKKIEQAARNTAISEEERAARIEALKNQLQQIQTQTGELERELFKLKLDGQKGAGTETAVK